MKKTMILSLCSILAWMLLSLYQVHAEEYPSTVKVTVKDDGSIVVLADKSGFGSNYWFVEIYKKDDVLDLSLPKENRPKFIAQIMFGDAFGNDGAIYPRASSRKVYQNNASAINYRQDVLTDGWNTPLKPGEYYAIVVYSGTEDGKPDEICSAPFFFTMNEWDRSLHVKREENGSFAFETKGFVSGYSDIRIYRQGAECNPKTKEGVVLSWAIDFQIKTRETYPEGCGTMKNIHGDLSAFQGGVWTRPLKSGNYYAIVVDENKGEILSDAVPFEVPAEPTPSATRPTPVRTPEAQATIQPTTENKEGHTLLYIGIAAAVIIVITAVILFVKRRGKT